jgi:hypothetical protein
LFHANFNNRYFHLKIGSNSVRSIYCILKIRVSAEKSDVAISVVDAYGWNVSCFNVVLRYRTYTLRRAVFGLAFIVLGADSSGVSVSNLLIGV